MRRLVKKKNHNLLLRESTSLARCRHRSPGNSGASAPPAGMYVSWSKISTYPTSSSPSTRPLGLAPDPRSHGGTALLAGQAGGARHAVPGAGPLPGDVRVRPSARWRQTTNKVPRWPEQWCWPSWQRRRWRRAGDVDKDASGFRAAHREAGTGAAPERVGALRAYLQTTERIVISQCSPLQHLFLRNCHCRCSVSVISNNFLLYVSF
jgi:hypothetical protein